MEADDWRCKCRRTFKSKYASGSKIAAKLNIPAGLVFLILKQPETVQLHNERYRVGTEGRRLEKVRAPVDFQTLKSSVLSKRPSGGVWTVCSART